MVKDTHPGDEFSERLLAYRKQAEARGLTLKFHVWAGDDYNAWFDDAGQEQALVCYSQTVERYGEGRLYVQLYSDVENDQMEIEDCLLSSCVPLASQQTRAY